MLSYTSRAALILSIMTVINHQSKPHYDRYTFKKKIRQSQAALLFKFTCTFSFWGGVKGRWSDGNGGSRYNTSQYDVQAAGEINKADLLVRINSAERKSDTPDKSPQVWSPGTAGAICVDLWLCSKATTFGPRPTNCVNWSAPTVRLMINEILHSMFSAVTSLY